MNKRCPACGESKAITEFYPKSGYCKPCFKAKQKIYRARPPRNPTPPGTKRCCTCKEIKSLDAFGQDPGTFDGRRERCKACDSIRNTAWRKNNLEHAAAKAREWRQKNSDRSADYFLKRLYNLPHGTYAAMLEQQGGKCAICGSPDPRNAHTNGRRFSVDHCHNTLRVRGLLCGDCNLGLGKFRHDIDVLSKAIQYLTRTYS